MQHVCASALSHLSADHPARTLRPHRDLYLLGQLQSFSCLHGDGLQTVLASQLHILESPKPKALNLHNPEASTRKPQHPLITCPPVGAAEVLESRRTQSGRAPVLSTQPPHSENRTWSSMKHTVYHTVVQITVFHWVVSHHSAIL